MGSTMPVIIYAMQSKNNYFENNIVCWSNNYKSKRMSKMIKIN